MKGCRVHASSLILTAVIQKILFPKSSSLPELKSCSQINGGCSFSECAYENTPISINSPYHGKPLLFPEEWEYGLTLQDTKISRPGQTLCMLREELCYHRHQARWAHSCSRKVNSKIPHNILERVRRRQQSNISTIHPHGKKQNPSPAHGEQKPRAPDSCWANLEPQQSATSDFLP